MIHPAVLPGFLAVRGGSIRQRISAEPVSWVSTGQVWLGRWGRGSALAGDPVMMIVSTVMRDKEGSIATPKVERLLTTDPAALTKLLPPFGAVVAEVGQTTMVADSLGFQQLFHTSTGSSHQPTLSTSSLVAGSAAGASLDELALAVQSMLGWQLGQRTLFAGVHKLAPGAVAYLNETGVRIAKPAPSQADEITLRRAVKDAAALLRKSLNVLLDDHPDAVLQLTGGMDSRLLLSAIPQSRRRGLRAMTLEVPYSGDVAIASAIADRYGIRHEVHGLADVGTLTPAEIWELCVDNAVRLDAMSDPVALTAQRVGERSFEQGVRISGLGGEIARGFYYFGRVTDRAYTRADAERLASWRMSVNEAVEPGLLTSEFSAWARRVVHEEVHKALLGGGPEWFRATDHLYVRHRMQRWAGATDGAVSDQRIVVNPMLDADFLDIAARLKPLDKAGSRFLALLQLELDPELARRALDHRPAPEVYANPPVWQPMLTGLSVGNRILRKAAQRLRRGNRPPAGGSVIARKVTQHLRANPSLLEPISSLSFVRPEWVDDVLTGRVEPRPSSIAFVTNLIAVTSSTSGYVRHCPIDES